MGQVFTGRSVDTLLSELFSQEEAERIVRLLGRKPTMTEVWLFHALWSEHCSYKSSLVHLRRLPREGEATLRQAGEENAGLLNIGEGWAVAFKVESHNHPSAVEPYQGAATGVGGIHRDIMAVGARPIAALNSLRFGWPVDPETRRLISGVVRGIGDYGNAFGVPTVGGEVYFAPEYAAKPLVNAMSVGILRVDKVVSARATTAGQKVYYLGSPTGPDGIGGAAFASETLEGSARENLPAIQVGDPFRQKVLLEALSEMVEAGLLAGMQDMGAAGLASATAETAARGQKGMRIYLDQVPLRGQLTEPYQLLLSESQERMLLMVEPEKAPAVEAIARKWDLPCVAIGEVVEERLLTYFWKGGVVAQLDPKLLTAGEGAPTYDWPRRVPAPYQHAFHLESFPDLSANALMRAAQWLVTHPNLASRAWIYSQYDRMVGASTMGSAAEVTYAAALVRLPGQARALAMSVDGNPFWVEADPRVGAALLVAEAARNVACTGARPLGITNGLNFGSPQDPEVYYTFVEVIEGMREACSHFGLPVTGGNVSFYNQDEKGPVLPTPIIGVVGLLERPLERATPIRWDSRSTCFLLLIGSGKVLHEPTLGASHYLRDGIGIRYSPAPQLDLEAERALQELLPALAEAGYLVAAQDVSDGGLLMALLEMAWASESGFTVEKPQGVRRDAFWFGEDGGRVVLATRPETKEKVVEAAQRAGLAVILLGETLPERGYAEVDGQRLDLRLLKALWERTLPYLMEE